MNSVVFNSIVLRRLCVSRSYSDAKTPFYKRWFPGSSSVEDDIEDEFTKRMEMEEAHIREIESEAQAETLRRSRNKSKLSASHRRELRDQHPLKGVVYLYDSRHCSKEYRMNMFGKYGTATGIDPSVCWPTKEELEDRSEYERVFYDGLDLPTIIKKDQELRLRKEKEAEEREQAIDENIQNMEKRLKQFQERVASKNRQMEKERLKKIAILAELREEYGYDVDSSMPHFAEKIATKEKEFAKREKEAKKSKRAERLAEIQAEAEKTRIEEEKGAN